VLTKYSNGKLCLLDKMLINGLEKKGYSKIIITITGIFLTEIYYFYPNLFNKKEISRL